MFTNFPGKKYKYIFRGFQRFSEVGNLCKLFLLFLPTESENSWIRNISKPICFVTTWNTGT